jgi:hypothetical protein
MNLAPVAADYIRTHRADCSDAEIRRALKVQGFSDQTLDAAFIDAGPRSLTHPAPEVPAGKRAIVRLLYAVSAVCLGLSIFLFARNVLHALQTPTAGLSR